MVLCADLPTSSSTGHPSRFAAVGFTDTIRDRLRTYGLFGEIISWKLRMFVPIDTGGVGLLSKVLERYPVARIAERAA